MRPKTKYSVAELGSLFKDGLSKAVTRPTIHGYIPHEKQIEFHSAIDSIRLYIGGNRSGKTVGGTVEDIWWLLGKHPYLKTPEPPVRGRIVTVSYIEGIQKIIIPELAKWLPPSDLINGSWEDSYSKSERTLTLSNGSFVELMSYDQKLEKFAGTSRHFVHFDEEPPKDIYTECRMRTMDVAGRMWITMTPVEGMTWIYDDLFLKGLQSNNNITVIIIDTEENPYISKAEADAVFADLDSKELEARKQGKFVQIGGLAFKSFDPLKHVIDPILPPHDWTHYASLDHGLNNPTCWLWHAVSPSGAVVTYDEIYANERLVDDYAREIHERNSQEGRRVPEIYVGDPAIAQRNGQTGDSIQTAYALNGVPIVLGNNDVKIRVEKMNRYLKAGRWLIAGNCSHLINELQRVRWKVYETARKRQDNNPREEIHKYKDHAPDSAGYFFGMMPDLYIPPQGQGNPEEVSAKEILKQVMSGARATPVGPQYFDTNVISRARTEWQELDEHLGGLW